MENPRLTFVTPTVIAGDRSLVDLVAHELAHSWSGNLVTNATWNDFWLNEGFTDYFEHRIMEQLVGRERSETIWLNDLFHLRQELADEPPGDQQLYVNLAGRDPDDAPDSVYGKGALLLRRLEETAGREKWDRFLHEYFDAHAFQSMTTEKFLALLAAGLPGVAEAAGAREWIYGPGLPANCPLPQSTALARVEADAARFAAGTPATAIDAARWSTQERVHFIAELPKLNPAQMAELDAAFHFSQTGNYEVLYTWLLKSVDDHYTAARPAIERFLLGQGRGRFVRPLYEKLAKDPDDLAFARKIYQVARPTYHPVVQTPVDATLK
jgi:predicted metalloprotease with PDZ domain